jgi:hypothetical protein
LDSNTPHLCGYEGEDTADYPKLYLTKFTGWTSTEIMNGGICVKKCPKGGEEAEDITLLENWSYSDITSSELSDINPTAYSSRDILDVCMPQLRKMEDERPDDYDAYKTVVEGMGESSYG